ncbi:MAG TPA: hypothetical protein VME18_04605 [Acidobacteriaceae bacterium]|nr:hypothetical protein [Acidobacteriaceae bacterium]
MCLCCQLLGPRGGFSRCPWGGLKEGFGQTDAGYGGDPAEQVGGAFEADFLMGRTEQEARIALLESEQAGFWLEGVHQFQSRASVIQAEGLAEKDDAEAALLQPRSDFRQG